MSDRIESPLPRPKRSRLSVFAIATATAAMLLGACAPAAPVLTVGDRSLKGTTLTSQAGDSFHATARNGSIRVDSSVTNRDSNTRMIFWAANSKPKVNGESCARFNQSSMWPTQEGVALRISHAGGHTTAITVTKNIMFGLRQIYNVHTWKDSAFTSRASINVSDSLVGSGDVNLCARMDAQVLTFKVWRSSNPEPAWSDKRLAHAVKIADAPAGAGTFGVYAGHIPRKYSATLTPFTSAPKASATPSPVDDHRTQSPGTTSVPPTERRAQARVLPIQDS